MKTMIVTLMLYFVIISCKSITEPLPAINFDKKIVGKWKAKSSADQALFFDFSAEGIFTKKECTLRALSSFCADDDYFDYSGNYEIEADRLSYLIADSRETFRMEFVGNDTMRLHGSSVQELHRLQLWKPFTVNGSVNRIGVTDGIKDSLALLNYTISANDLTVETDSSGAFVFNDFKEGLYEFVLNDGRNDVISKRVHVLEGRDVDFYLEFDDYFPVALGNTWEYKYQKTSFQIENHLTVLTFEGKAARTITNITRVNKATIVKFSNHVTGLNLDWIYGTYPPVYDTVGVVNDTSHFIIEITEHDELVVPWFLPGTTRGETGKNRYCPASFYGETVRYDNWLSWSYRIGFAFKVNVGMTSLHTRIGSDRYNTASSFQLIDYQLNAGTK